MYIIGRLAAPITPGLGVIVNHNILNNLIYQYPA